MTGAHPFRGQVVDTETAWEFANSALERITEAELGDIGGLVEQKSRALASLVGAVAERDLDAGESGDVLRTVFASRRRAPVILEAWGPDGFSRRVRELIAGPGRPGSRLAAFHDSVAAIDGVPASTGYDLASELLHFTQPDRYWLWTRWIWDPDAETGALPLVVTEDVDLVGADMADTYERVGVAIAFVNETGEAAGFRRGGHGVFDTDVFLACVYAVYMYTTLRMRMTQEFNQVVPDLGELLRRLLGVHRSPLLAGSVP